jgi:hypothetical protein
MLLILRKLKLIKKKSKFQKTFIFTFLKNSINKAKGTKKKTLQDIF